MEDILRPLYQKRASSDSTLGILLVEKKHAIPDITETFDYILLVITTNKEQPVQVKHYCYKNEKAALHTINIDQVKEWLLLGSNRKLTEWLHNGKLIFDRNENITALKREIVDFPFHGRKLKKGLEFAKLIRRYMDGKAFFEAGQFMDAYNHIVHSLHHLARLAIIENGFYPEITVWEQVKSIEPQIYKLYEELITSDETLNKRLELLFLASEFLIYSKTEVGVEHFMEIVSSRNAAWTVEELREHPEIKHYAVDLTVLLEYLIDKRLIEAEKVPTKGNDLYHRLYRAR